jgi:sugar lactone lactonase YvrE
MKRLLLLAVFLLICTSAFTQTPPKIAYSGPQVLGIGSAITPITPTNIGGAVSATVYGTVSVFAGNDSYYNFTNGTGTAASFYGPGGLAKDKNGNLYVSDQYNNRIRKITPAGVVTTFAGDGVATLKDGTGAAASFSYPSGLAIDVNGNIFVADRNNNCIRKITPAGVVTTFAGNITSGAANGKGTAASFYKPYGLTIDGSGNLYVADQYNSLIRKITSAGVVTTIAGKGYPDYSEGTGVNAGFSYPTGVVLDAAGNLFVADNFNNKIRKITPAGVVTTFAGSGDYGSTDGPGNVASFNQTTGVTFDEQGNMYVADQQNNAVRMITKGGVVSTLANYSNSNLLNSPNSLIVSKGKLYVTCFGSNRILAINISGYSIDNTLPEGLEMDAKTGIISGTPQVLSSAKNYIITALNDYGSGSATINIAVVIPKLPPVIASFNPATGTAGNVMSIVGNNFLGTTQVAIGGKAITNFKILSSNLISAVIPVGAASGSVSVTNPYGTTSLAGFTLVNAPAISYESPKNFETGSPIAPFLPVNSGGAVPANNINKISAIAGSGYGNFADGTGKDASFNYPRGLTTDPEGNIYVADSQNRRIRKITPAGVVTTLAGNDQYGMKDGTGSAASFYSPSDIIYVSNNLFVTDYYSIRKVTLDGKVTTFAGGGYTGNKDGTGTDAFFSNLKSITADASGNLFVTDGSNNNIRKITTAGVVTTFAGNGNYSTTDGTGTGASFLYVGYITIDNSGNLYVTENEGQQLRKITPAGVVTTLSATTGIYGANGIKADISGNLFVTTGSGLIYMINAQGITSKVAGLNDGTYATDGDITLVSLGYLNGLTFDQAGDLYVIELFEQKIKKIIFTGFSVNPILPEGLTLNADGSVTGTATKAITATDYTFTAKNLAGSSSTIVKIATVIPALPPVLTTVSPASAGYGQAISITGTNLLGATEVKIGSDAVPFTISSPTSIVAAVNTHTSGDITVSNEYGAATYTGFTVTPPPVISYTTPQTFTVGTAKEILPQNTGSAIPNVQYALTTTLAGSSQYGSGNGTGATAFFSEPNGVVTDVLGNIYVADTYNNLIRKVTPEGVVTIFAGKNIGGASNGKGTSASFNYPRGLAFDSAGNFYIVDSNNNLIRKITPDGTVSTFAGNGSSGAANGTALQASFSSPTGIALDENGNIFIGDTENNMIRKITPEGVVSTLAGSGGYGADNGDGASATFLRPEGLAVDADGNVYVADTYNHMIRKITPAGVVSTFAGSSAQGSKNGKGSDASFNYPSSVTIDNYGNLYVADKNNSSIRMITADGTVTTIAGNGGAETIDGIGTTAGFRAPAGVYADSYGNLYVTDANTIRKLNLTGYTVTPALSAGLLFDNATGKISGTAIETTSAVVYTVTGVNANGYSTAQVTIDTKTPETPPVINSFFPVAAAPGGFITITGENFTGTTSVQIGGKPASSFTVLSPTVITAKLGDGLTGKDVKVTNVYGTGTRNGFTILQSPSISYPGAKEYNTGINITPLTVTNSGSKIPNALLGQVTTWAGTNPPNGGSSVFSQPGGITADAAGNLYIVDMNYGQGIIQKITPAGVVTVLAGHTGGQPADGTGTAAGFGSIRWIAADASGNLFVSETWRNKIRKVTPLGVVTTFAGSGIAANNNGTGISAGFNAPSGVAFDAAGNLYVADAGNYKIRKITPAGIVTTFAGSGEAGAVNGAAANAKFGWLTGMVVDKLGNVYVSELGNLIRKITPDGTVSTFAGSGSPGAVDGTGTAASFNAPQGLSIDEAGNIYVADHDNHQIRKITPGGVVSTITGNAAAGFSNGLGKNALFNSPYGMVITTGGDLYIAEEINRTIRKVALSGYNVSPDLPEGLTMDGSGTISGKPLKISPATNYTVTAINNAGSSSSTINIKVTVPKIAPVVTSFTPKAASAGSVITITGNNFTGATAVSIGGAAVAGYYVLSPTQIIAVVSSGSASGSIKITNPYGSASTIGFTFNKPPQISYTNNLTFVAGTAITPLSPNNTGTAVPAAVYLNTTLFAGNSQGYYGSVNGTGPGSSFNNPGGLAIDGVGNIYVADVNNNMVRKITPAAVVTTFAGTGYYGSTNDTGTKASFYSPCGVVSDASGNLYVADFFNNRIRKITPQGAVTTFAGNGANASVDGKGLSASFNNPAAISIDGSGNLYVSESTGNRIRKITADGVVTTLAGSTEGNANGTGNKAQFYFPRGIVSTLNGTIYVADTENNLIRQITPAGVVTTFAGTGKAGNTNGTRLAASFNRPAAITVDVSGNLYVGEKRDIRMIRTDGSVITLAGNNNYNSAYTDGVGTSANFSDPAGLVIDKSGNLLVADRSANMIRKISLAGYTINNTLPQGLAFNNTTGVISGTPLKVQINPVSYVVTGYNVNGSSTTTVSFKVDYPKAPKISISSSVIYTAGTKITPLKPSNTGGGVPTIGYGNVTTIAGSGKYGNDDGIGIASSVAAPAGMVQVANGDVYLAQIGMSRIAKISPNNVLTNYAGTKDHYYGGEDGPVAKANFNTPTDIAVDSKGKFYIIDNQKIIRKISNGIVSFLSELREGSKTGKYASFNTLWSITIDKSDNLYITDRGNNMIRKITTAGIVSTFAGKVGMGSTNGTGTSASFNDPEGITIDSKGNLYIADAKNNLIRKITPAAVVTTVAAAARLLLLMVKAPLRVLITLQM